MFPVYRGALQCNVVPPWEGVPLRGAEIPVEGKSGHRVAVRDLARAHSAPIKEGANAEAEHK